MTVKEKTGRRRYVYFRSISPTDMKRLSSLIDGRIVYYREITALRVAHLSLPLLREKTREMGLEINMISGTLKALRRKILKIH
jgi:RNase P/RNase MRP subunit POP5